MQFTIVALFSAVAIASPLTARTEGNYACNPQGLLYSQAQCCATNVLNLADLDCKSAVWGTPTSFGCGGGQKPSCCSIPVLGQALLCQDAVRL